MLYGIIFGLGYILLTAIVLYSAARWLRWRRAPKKPSLTEQKWFCIWALFWPIGVVVLLFNYLILKPYMFVMGKLTDGFMYLCTACWKYVWEGFQRVATPSKPHVEPSEPEYRKQAEVCKCGTCVPEESANT